MKNTVWILVLLFVVGCGKPDIDVTCSLNGLGSGKCSFTNKGDGAGSLCGRVGLLRLPRGIPNTTGYEEGRIVEVSSAFCSGEVTPKSTVQIGFTMSEVHKECHSNRRVDESWHDVCDLGFVTSGSPQMEKLLQLHRQGLSSSQPPTE